MWIIIPPMKLPWIEGIFVHHSQIGIMDWPVIACFMHGLVYFQHRSTTLFFLGRIYYRHVFFCTVAKISVVSWCFISCDHILHHVSYVWLINDHPVQVGINVNHHFFMVKTWNMTGPYHMIPSMIPWEGWSLIIPPLLRETPATCSTLRRRTVKWSFFCSGKMDGSLVGGDEILVMKYWWWNTGGFKHDWIIFHFIYGIYINMI